MIKMAYTLSWFPRIHKSISVQAVKLTRAKNLRLLVKRYLPLAYLCPETNDDWEARNNKWVISIEKIHSQAIWQVPLKRKEKKFHKFWCECWDIVPSGSESTIDRQNNKKLHQLCAQFFRPIDSKWLAPAKNDCSQLGCALITGIPSRIIIMALSFKCITKLLK